MHGLYLILLGGWLLLMVDSSTTPPAWTAQPSYRGISKFTNHKMGITVSAMKELRGHLSFTQMRSHCSKQQGRTFQVTTANSSGEAVVQYFSGQTNTRPDSLLLGWKVTTLLFPDIVPNGETTDSQGSGGIKDKAKHVCAITLHMLPIAITGWQPLETACATTGTAISL